MSITEPSKVPDNSPNAGPGSTSKHKVDPNLSRRDFLKLGGLGLAAAFLQNKNFLFADAFSGQQGRVTSRIAWMYNLPSVEGTQVKLCRRDMILDIVNTAISEDVNAHNRVWYEIGTQDYIEGYVYSGNIQPVRTILNTPTFVAIPVEGLLVEVSVPYTDAHEGPQRSSPAAYRMYYETTHWIKGITRNSEDQIWYEIHDDKWDKYYYARGEHLRILSPEELAPITPEVPNSDKKIEVHLEPQLLTAYENGIPVFTSRVSTGGIFRSGKYTTPRGSFVTYYKRPSRHMAAGDLTASGFDLPGVPWVQYITESGISLHGTFWHNDFGRPRSHGCINLSVSAAKWLYRWSLPQVPFDKVFSYGDSGTIVEIQL
jgi:hypothetical protein